MEIESRAKAYLSKIAGGPAKGGLFERVAGPGGLEGAGRRQVAQDAIRKLDAGAPLSKDDQFNLEAIIIPDLRPAVRIRNGDFNVTHSSWLHLNTEISKQIIIPKLASVGRIELPGHPSLPYGGTGFVVGDRLLMTNRHVAEIFTSGLGIKSLVFRPGIEVAVDFKREDETDPPQLLEVSSVRMVHPYWDMALLEVENLPENRKPLKLSVVHPDDLVGREIIAIGYPAFDPRNSAAVQDRVFGGVYNVKRLQPGVVNATRSVKSFQNTVDALTHDSSTLGGASGSVILDVKTGHAVGLHFGGRYLDANFAVPSYELARDQRVVDTGISFFDMPSPSAGPADGAWLRVEGSSDEQVKGSNKVTVDVPIRITVEIGTPGNIVASIASTHQQSAPDHTDIEAMVEPIHETDYTSRTGYDTKFLGIEVPIPMPTDDKIMAETKDGAFVIPYHHFSVVMHRQRRLAMITAANVDANPRRKKPERRPDKEYTRAGLSGLGKNDQEKWFSDDRLAANFQLPDRFFTKDRKAFDKGHLVRREDVAWGGSYNEVRGANGDTYHVTNCSPQVAGFNRASEENWGGLENEVLKQAAAEKLAVFAGPVLSDDDRTFVGVDDAGTISVKIPSRYWKVIVSVEDGKAQAFGFVLEQDLGDVDWEYLVTAKWAAHMRSISEIEEITGLQFPEIVRSGDQSGLVTFESLEKEASKVSDDKGEPAGVDALLEDLSPIFEGWILQQAAGNVSTEVRMTLNYRQGTKASDDELRQRLQARLSLDVEVGPLFGEESDLQDFRLLRIPSVSRIDRADLFDLARVVRVVTGADEVEPDLGTDYYGDEATIRSGSGPEAPNLTFWCWAEDKDAPLDRDWAINKTNVPQAWALSVAENRPSEGEGIRIFQPDTGIIAHHDEILDGLPQSADSANFVDTEQKGALDPMSDGHNPGHGTGTASVIVSPTPGLMRGVAPKATLVPVRCVRSVAVFDQSPVAQAIDHARLKGAHVITMSLGGVFSNALKAAVQKAVGANIIVVAAAGNCVGEVVWPARYPEVIAVGGINEVDRPWKGSSRGPSVTIAGPAEFVLRADARHVNGAKSVTGGQGTSFATAHLAGIAALWLAHHGRDKLLAKLPKGKTMQDMFRAVITQSARIPLGFDTANYGAGVVDGEGILKINPVSALAKAPKPAPSGVLDQLTGLLDGVFGDGASESVSVALADSQNYPELAAAALDRLRARRSALAATEALPPPALSSGLRLQLGGRTEVISRATEVAIDAEEM